MIVESPRDVYCIADIHGDFDSFATVLGNMIMDGLTFTQDLLIQLGDIIDGAPRSSECVRLLHELATEHPQNVVVLLGNHEDLLLQAVGKDEYQSGLRMWWYQGGEATWNSYKEDSEQPLWLSEYGCAHKFKPNTYMETHVEWFKTLPLYHETENLIFVHGGLRPMLPLKAQRRHDLLWIRDEFWDSPYEWEKPVVYGHTARKKPLIAKGKIGLDTMWHGTGHVGGAKFHKGKIVKMYA